MSDVFISFIHEEEQYAEAVQKFITGVLGTDAEPFLSSDKFQVYAGERWLDRIVSELGRAKVAILMLSPVSVKRPWVNFEAGAAWVRNIVAIPVCYRGLKKDQLPRPYSSLQAVNLLMADDHEYLARSVAHHLGLPEPFRSLYGLSPALLDGTKTKKEVERQDLAYQQLRQALDELEKN